MSRINKTLGSSEVQDIDLSTQEQALAKLTNPLTESFAGLKFDFAKHGVQLYRTNWRDGSVTFFTIKNQRARHISTLSELAAIQWAWEKNHG